MSDAAFNIMSVDVEDWYHVLDTKGTPDLSAWERMPARVEENFRRMLGLLAECDTTATCFFLGWIAERFPHLVREAAEAGHEVASHGYAHELLFRLDRESFLEDAKRAKAVIEDAAGCAVGGYRAPGFSVTEDTPWLHDALAEAGYTYDSSVFPARRGHGGMIVDTLSPYTVATPHGDVVEFPITIARVGGLRVCFFGGGYMRLFPYGLIRAMTKKVNAEGRPAVFYVHPREIDPDQPRLPMSLPRRFKSYVNIATTEPKLRALMGDFNFTSFAHWLDVCGKPPAGGGAVRP